MEISDETFKLGASIFMTCGVGFCVYIVKSFNAGSKKMARLEEKSDNQTERLDKIDARMEKHDDRLRSIESKPIHNGAVEELRQGIRQIMQKMGMG